jgi:hypothetical protein
MSPRAASRLEALGLPRVYDYAAGKADWGSFALPLEGTADSSTRVFHVAATTVPTCHLVAVVAVPGAGSDQHRSLKACDEAYPARQRRGRGRRWLR